MEGIFNNKLIGADRCWLVGVWRRTRPVTGIHKSFTMMQSFVGQGSLTLTSIWSEEEDLLEYERGFSSLVIYVNCAYFSQFPQSEIFQKHCNDHMNLQRAVNFNVLIWYYFSLIIPLWSLKIFFNTIFLINYIYSAFIGQWKYSLTWSDLVTIKVGCLEFTLQGPHGLL